ncbi:lysophospholipid acyltransferase family protein [Bosea sp. PAMC 26642]|uniref:lysophospholipid acyltransferase family protein n=1 Tax=Bosea sp. (strain PAMC 26642) TaxID=1792307 RepID=UPI00077013DA|nr:lysophospholipid acyltransferase family protein [Bosea sp. PAMC 26642]AMJ61769.1 acyl-phosphate glycerol 3-phosphate acyltransferase [Bosea sp. PAMC 26642]
MRFDYRPVLKSLAGSLFAGVARAITGVVPIWQGTTPSRNQRIYFANHASHGDFILLSSCLEREERGRTSAVAGADYWKANSIRRFIARDLLHTVLVERSGVARSEDPMAVMLDVLADGRSLIFFPEGTRNMGDEPLLPFRSGLYNLAAARPDVELVPCWIENMSRVLPKGMFLPVPILCRVIFGEPIGVLADEDRKVFLQRARQALLDLKTQSSGERP